MDTTQTLKNALAAFRESDFSLARDLCETLLKQNQDNPGALRILGQISYQEGNPEEAADLLEKSLNLKPDQFSIWLKLGNIWADLGDHKKAIEIYSKAIEFPGNHDLAFLSRAQSYNALGSEENAWADLDRAVQINPSHGQTYRMMVLYEHPATKQTGWEHNLLQRLTNGLFQREDALQVHYALASYFENIETPKRMWDHLNKANGLQKNLAASWVESYENLMSRSREIFSPDLLEQSLAAAAQTPTPVFIVGLPRSGSTLLELMLSRHPEIAAAGEATALTKTIGHQQANVTMLPFPEGMDMVGQDDLAALSSVYLGAMKRAARGKPFVTDKLLSNGLFIGFIKMILPRAKIIHMRRDPLDSAFSIYKNYFWEQQNPGFCSLKDIGLYARMIEDMMAHWKTLFPGGIHDIFYEDLVGDTEETFSQALDFIGLSWDASCLDHQAGPKRAETLSTTQATKPVYSTSIGRGKIFETELAPFQAAFSPKGN